MLDCGPYTISQLKFKEEVRSVAGVTEEEVTGCLSLRRTLSLSAGWTKTCGPHTHPTLKEAGTLPPLSCVAPHISPFPIPPEPEPTGNALRY